MERFTHGAAGPMTPGAPGRAKERAHYYHMEIDRVVGEALSASGYKGVKAGCTPGCAWCCFIPVYATPPEAELAAHYIRNSLADKDSAELLSRVKSWGEWNEAEVPFYVESGVDPSAVHRLYGPGCPMLSGSMCIIYPVRPMGCRVHFSRTPELCHPHGDLPDEPQPIAGILDAVKPVCMDYRKTLEGMGIRLEEELRLFPELLLIEMKRPH